MTIKDALGNRLLLKYRDIRVSHLSTPSSATLSKILQARENVSGEAIRRFDEAVNGNGVAHFLFALDRLYVIGGTKINADAIELPATLPADFRKMLLVNHPIFTWKNNNDR